VLCRESNCFAGCPSREWEDTLTLGALSRGMCSHFRPMPVGARAYDVTAVLTFSAAAARGALARGVCLDELSTKHSIRPDF
jgi:hypothetical protein